MRNSISGVSMAVLAFALPMAALAQLTIAPTSQTVSNAGNSATYTGTVTNPTGTTQTFVPSTSGITAAWGVQLPASIVVAPGGTQNFTLVLTTPINAASGPYPFMLIVNTVGGLSYSASATLTIAGVTVTDALAEVDTYITTSATQQVNTFQTELKARVQGGSYLFDQTYSVAFTDPSFAAHITQAKGVLTGAGAVSFTGPTQLSSNQSTTSSTSTVQTESQSTGSVVTTAYLGPQTIYVGNLGICSTVAIAQAASQTNGCSISGTLFPIAAGQEDFNTLEVNQVTISQTATTTNTTLTSQVYEIDGFGAGAAPLATPAPPSVILAFLGLAGLGIYAVKKESGVRRQESE
jgi:hypothetical protein